MVAILNMQISLFSKVNQINPLEGAVFRKISDEYWQLESVYIDLGYAN